MGTTIVNSAVISGGGQIITYTAATGVFAQVLMPCISSYYCPDFFDDFSDPTSGWEVVDDDFVRALYREGEYRIVTKKGGYFYLFRAPTCDRRNYVVEVDARWVSKIGSSYGLIFGLTHGFSQYYLFDMNTDYRQFRLFRRDAEGFHILVGPTPSAAINGGEATNHLHVVRTGDQITLMVNGTVLHTLFDGTIGGRTGAGLVTLPYSHRPESAAHFDNFSMVSLPGSGTLALQPTGMTQTQNEPTAPKARRVPAPPDMEW